MWPTDGAVAAPTGGRWRFGGRSSDNGYQIKRDSSQLQPSGQPELAWQNDKNRRVYALDLSFWVRDGTDRTGSGVPAIKHAHLNPLLDPTQSPISADKLLVEVVCGFQVEG